MPKGKSKTKALAKTASKVMKQLSKDLGKSPLAQAARGKRTRGYF